MAPWKSEDAASGADDPARTIRPTAILNAVVDAGINFIDTSNDYGKSELYIGQFLAGAAPTIFLATKCGCHVEYAGDHDETPPRLDARKSLCATYQIRLSG